MGVFFEDLKLSWKKTNIKRVGQVSAAETYEDYITKLEELDCGRLARVEPSRVSAMAD
jgi:hypothetical protein